MKKALLTTLVLLAASTSAAYAQSSASTAAQSDSGAVAQTGAITFQSSPQPDRIHTTPPIYVAPSMFGGASNCGMSDTATLGVAGFGVGGSRSKESDACNARMDTQTAYNLGYQDVAALRFFCFGEEENRQAFEASGRQCPQEKQAQAQAQAQAQVAVAGGLPTTVDAAYTGNDPLVRARLGLPY